MKKVKILVTALVLFTSATAFANGEENVTQKVQDAFRHDFSGVNEVSWKKQDVFYFASFTLNNCLVDAAYDEEGQLVGTSRSIRLAQLPLNVSLQLKKDYDGYQVNDNVLELNYEGATRYYLTVYNDKQLLKLKALSNGDITVESKTKI